MNDRRKKRSAYTARCPPWRRTGRRVAGRRGYVLLLTLMLLALAATVMAGVSRSSLRRALEARSASEDLQRRWAVVSLRSALLPRAGRLLEAGEASAGEPLRAMSGRVDLGGQRFELVLADEQAKLDVNALAYYRGRAAAQAALDRLLAVRAVRAKARLLAGAPYPGRGAADRGRSRAAEDTPGAATGQDSPDDHAPDLELLFTGDDDEGDDDGGEAQSLFDADRPLQSLGQVFPGAHPSLLLGSRDAPGAAVEVTCWGDGRLNFTRAAPEAVEQAVAPLLAASQARRLVALRNELPGTDLGELAALMQLPQGVHVRLEERLCDDSACHSLWIVAVARGRSWHYLGVLDASGGEGVSPIQVFEW